MTLDELERDGYMFSKGYRPSGRNQHISVVMFAELFLTQGQKARGKRVMSKGGPKFKELRVWQKGKELAVYIYRITNTGDFANLK